MVTRLRAATVCLLALLTALGIVLVTSIPPTQAVITASIANSGDTAGAVLQNCRFAMSRIAATSPSDLYAAYAISGTSSASETDISGNGRIGTWRKQPTISSSVGCTHDDPAQSVTFDGSQCLYVPGVLNNPSTFSLEAWFSTTTIPNGKIVGFGSSPTPEDEGGYDRHIYIDNTGRVALGLFAGGFTTIFTPPGTSYADGRWHAVVATVSSGVARLYVDGTLVGTKTNASPASYTGYWKFGCGKTALWPNTPQNAPMFFTGDLQYGAIYDRALTAGEVQSHWLDGTW